MINTYTVYIHTMFRGDKVLTHPIWTNESLERSKVSRNIYNMWTFVSFLEDFSRSSMFRESLGPMPWCHAAFSKVFVNEAYVSQIEGLPEANYSNFRSSFESSQTPLLHFQWLSDLSELQSLTSLTIYAPTPCRMNRSSSCGSYVPAWRNVTGIAGRKEMSWPLEIKGVVESFLGVQVPTSNTEVRKKWGFHSMMIQWCSQLRIYI